MKIGTTSIVLVKLEVDVTKVSKIIWTLKSDNTTITKNYPNDVTYADGYFGLPLTQENTTALGEGIVRVEGQVNYSDKAVAKTETISFRILPTLATEVVTGNAPTGGIEPEELKVKISGDVIIAQATGGGSGTWGSITGTLSDQTDLKAALDSKANTNQIPSLNGYATESYVTNAISDKADRSEIPSLTGYATQNWVQNQGYTTSEIDDNTTGVTNTWSASKINQNLSDLEDDVEELETETDSINDILNGGENILSFVWEVGTINTAGSNANNNYVIRTRDYNVIDGELQITIPSGYRLEYFEYDSNKNKLASIYWKTSNFSIVCKAENYYRFIINNKSKEDSGIVADVSYADLFTFKGEANVGLINKVSTLEKNLSIIPRWFYPIKTTAICHRGNNGTGHSENSKEAFEAGAKDGFLMLETDIYRTTDNVWVCSHSNQLSDGYITNSAYDDIKDITTSSGEVAYPKLETFIDICRRYGCVPTVEVKVVDDSVTSGYMSSLNIKSLLKIFKDKNMIENLAIQSFDSNVLTKIRNESDLIQLHWLKSSPFGDGDISQMKSMKNMVASNSNTQNITQDYINKLHENGILLALYTFYSATSGVETNIANFADMGVDMLFTDGLNHSTLAGLYVR